MGRGNVAWMGKQQPNSTCCPIPHHSCIQSTAINTRLLHTVLTPSCSLRYPSHTPSTLLALLTFFCAPFSQFWCIPLMPCTPLNSTNTPSSSTMRSSVSHKASTCLLTSHVKLYANSSEDDTTPGQSRPVRHHNRSLYPEVFSGTTTSLLPPFPPSLTSTPSHLERKWTWLFGCHPSACALPGQSHRHPPRALLAALALQQPQPPSLHVRSAPHPQTCRQPQSENEG